MTIIEKILSNHSNKDSVKAGDIPDVTIDVRGARDFGGANVIQHIEKNDLPIIDSSKCFFTFDTNPTGSDQKYAVNQHICRTFARKHGIKVYDIDNGIGTHTFIDEGLAYPGTTVVTTDSHANILGAIGAFGQGMGDKDIAAAFSAGKVWFKVPKSVKLNFKGERPEGISAKDIVLNLLKRFGANSLLGYSVELYGDAIDKLSLDERITIASMGTEMGVVTLMFPPNQEVIDYCSLRTGKEIQPVYADDDAEYEAEYDVDISEFINMVSLPGKPHDAVAWTEAHKVKIDSAFIGSCTNGRMEDLREAAEVLKGRKVAPGVVLKIVPTTDKIWRQALDEGLIDIFKQAGALLSNAGCAGCAAGQVGQNGPGEITISTGNRNFPGKQGKGSVYLASPANVAASAVAGYITVYNRIPDIPAVFEQTEKTSQKRTAADKAEINERPMTVKGRIWLIDKDNIDTDMIFHNRYLAITDINEMGQYAFDNLEGYEDFSKKVKEGDIIITGKNFGSGSSRQQAVDCFKALGVQAVVAKSFGSIYERNAINAAFPVLTYDDLSALKAEDKDEVELNFETGKIKNLSKGTEAKITPFYEVQGEIYQKGGLF
jgi:homoaconitate hydratase family protein/3-isopropylmalate dehydratase small subunit